MLELLDKRIQVAKDVNQEPESIANMEAVLEMLTVRLAACISRSSCCMISVHVVAFCCWFSFHHDVATHGCVRDIARMQIPPM